MSTCRPWSGWARSSSAAGMADWGMPALRAGRHVRVRAVCGPWSEAGGRRGAQGAADQAVPGEGRRLHGAPSVRKAKGRCLCRKLRLAKPLARLICRVHVSPCLRLATLAPSWGTRLLCVHAFGTLPLRFITSELSKATRRSLATMMPLLSSDFNWSGSDSHAQAGKPVTKTGTTAGTKME